MNHGSLAPSMCSSKHASVRPRVQRSSRQRTMVHASLTIASCYVVRSCGSLEVCSTEERLGDRSLQGPEGVEVHHCQRRYGHCCQFGEPYSHESVEAEAGAEASEDWSFGTSREVKVLQKPTHVLLRGVVVLFVQIGALCSENPLHDKHLRFRHFRALHPFRADWCALAPVAVRVQNPEGPATCRVRPLRSGRETPA